MRNQGLILSLVLSATCSCGSQDARKPSNLKDVKVPSALIIAVKGDQTKQDELRVVSSDKQQLPAQEIQEQDIPKVYQQSQQAEQILKTEQYNPVSVQQQGWLHYRQCPDQLVRVRVETQAEPIILQSCVDYHLYQPAFIHRGLAHRFFFHRAYRLQDVTYYYYVQSKQAKEVLEKSKEKTQEQGQEQQEKQEQNKQQEQTPDCKQSMQSPMKQKEVVVTRC